MYNNIRWVTLFFLISVPLILFQSCKGLTSNDFDDSISFIRSVEAIEGAQNVTINLKNGHSEGAFFMVDLSGISPNPYIINGWKKAWCIEWDKPVVRGDQKGVKLHSTRGQDLWNEVNYFLSNKESYKQQYPGLGWRESQIIIWSLVKHKEFEIDEIPTYQGFSQNFYKDGEYLFNVKLAKEIIERVKSNTGKQKISSEEKYAIILENEGQTVIIESGESVWAYGQHSFRNHYLRDLLEINKQGSGQWGWIFELEGETATTELIAGGGNDDGSMSAEEVGAIIGDLEMNRSDNTLTLTYSMRAGYLVNDLHMWVGCSLEEFPWVNDTGNVAPGSLPYFYDSYPTSSYTFSIDLSSLNCAGNLFISAHAGELLMRDSNVSPDDLVPVFELIKLDNTGLSVATDINDQGDIIGGNLYWNNSTNTLIDMSLRGLSINNNGQVLVDDRLKAYIWKENEGKFNIGVPYNLSDSWDESQIFQAVRPRDINNLGDVVGTSYTQIFDFDDDGYPTIIDKEWDEAYYWSKQDGFKMMSTDLSEGLAINDRGQGVGWDSAEKGFIWDKVNRRRDLISLSEAQGVRPVQINNKGQVIGTLEDWGYNQKALKLNQGPNKRSSEIRRLYSKTYTEGIFHYSEVIDMISKGTFQEEAIPIIEKYYPNHKSLNNLDVILNEIKQSQIYEATVNNSYVIRAFIWDENNGAVYLGPNEGIGLSVVDINDNGQVIGRSYYWDQVHGMVNLPGLGGGSRASAINNNGQIVGYSYDEHGQYYPVLWQVTFEERDKLVSN